MDRLNLLFLISLILLSAVAVRAVAGGEDPSILGIGFLLGVAAAALAFRRTR